MFRLSNKLPPKPLGVHPLILGSGRRLFEDGGQFAALTLRHAKTTSNGVLIATYWPAKNAEG